MSVNRNFTQVDVTDYLKEIRLFHKKEFPNVVRSSLTSQASLTSVYAKRNVESEFTLRNRYTLGSIRYLPARGNKPSKMQSEAGSYQEYMALQEHGGKSDNKALTTQEARVRKDRKKVTRKRLRLSQVGSLPEFKDGNVIGDVAAFSRNGEKTKMAIIEGRGFTRGIYAVTRVSSKRKGKNKNRAPFKIRMMYSLKRDSYEIDETPWLMPATQKTMSPKKLFRTYEESMKKHVKNYSNGVVK